MQLEHGSLELTQLDIDEVYTVLQQLDEVHEQTPFEELHVPVLLALYEVCAYHGIRFEDVRSITVPVNCSRLGTAILTHFLAIQEVKG